MQLPFRRRRAASRRPLFSSLLSSLLAGSSIFPLSAGAISFTSAPSADLDLSQLGQVAIVGDFAGLSLYQYQEQTENPPSINGSQALLARVPNGVFAPVINTDASIQAMCSLTLEDGSVAGVVIGGNFTSLGNRQSTAIALFNPNTSEITPLPGLSGAVSAVLCDQDSSTVYVGGNFVGHNSTNAISWVGGRDEGFKNLPFAGFNGPVSSIVKASNGHVIFGGAFTGLGNASTPTERDGQVINLSAATITSGSSSTDSSFSDPRSIICSADSSGGSGKTWLLQDQTPGFWEASFGFSFEPTKLRLRNTQDGRGTKTWRFTAFPINGIMNFTYIDPATKQNASCTNQCPLSDDPSVPFQDFHFVNVVGMDEFRIDISEFYGRGGGLDGVELFADDISAYAINDFNEPACANLGFSSGATPTGPWNVSPSQSSSSQYLTAELSAPITPDSASIVFSPDIRESGHYSVNLYTPGCAQDNTCTTRGQFVISGQMTADPTKSTPINRTLFQTNDFDKYDQIYFGQIDASSGGFRPAVTMTPAAGQDLETMTFVAQRVGFTMINSTGGLNGLYDYDPKSTVVNTSDFQNSAFNRLGDSFDSESAVNALATAGDVVFIGGNFTSRDAQNVIAVNARDSKTQSLDGGLNGEVLSMYLNDTTLFVGGKFSNTRDRSANGLNNVAAYDTSRNAWSPLGAGVDGIVTKVVPLTMNITSTTPELVVSFTGDFRELSAFDGNPAVPANGFGVWVPSQKNWLRNLDMPVERLDGSLSSSILDFPGGGSGLYAGSISSSKLAANGVATLGNQLGRVPVKIQSPPIPQPSAGARRRTLLSNESLSGIVTGAFDTENKRNITILGGRFTATATNGSVIHNLALLDGSDDDNVIGFGSEITENSTFAAVAVQGDNLFAGGNVTGTIRGGQVRGLVSYNLASNSYNAQPPPLTGGNATVSSIAVRPKTDDVYVGGSFSSAGSLQCPGVCFFSTGQGQWNQPGQGLEGSASWLMWASDTKLLVGGNLTLNGTTTSYLASYDSGDQSWDAFPGSDQLPGPVDVLTRASEDAKQLWVSGTSLNGSIYLMKYDGSKWASPDLIFEPGTAIRGLQMFSVTSSHDSTPLVEPERVLMVSGALILPDFGGASAVLYDGKTFRPYALAAKNDNSPGTISAFFSEKQNFFESDNGHLPLVFVVLIGLGISLGLMLLLVASGMLLDRLRKKREGYTPAPTSMYDRGSGMQRIPPQDLLGNIGRPQPGPPQV